MTKNGFDFKMSFSKTVFFPLRRIMDEEVVISSNQKTGIKVFFKIIPFKFCVSIITITLRHDKTKYSAVCRKLDDFDLDDVNDQMKAEQVKLFIAQKSECLS